MSIVLASTSPYRRQLLERLALPFTAEGPGFDESPLQGETPAGRPARLALGKAMAVARLRGDANPALVIGSDQVAVLDGEILGKPGDHDGAVRQLTHCSGRRLQFLTAIACVNTATGTVRSAVEPFAVQFRSLTAAEIDAYVRAERPYDCAGSFRAESLGIALFDRMEGRDPTALIGLPLIALCGLLREEGIEPLLGT